MGKNHSAPTMGLNAEKPRRSLHRAEKVHNLKICTPFKDLIIKNLDYTMTCGWLLSEAIRKYDEEKSLAILNKTLVALKTKDDLDILDEYLLRFEKSLKPFREINEIVAVFAEDSENLDFDDYTTIKNFNVLKTIGLGTHSKVLLCRKKNTGILYAVKVIEKSEVLLNSRLEQVISERTILSQISHGFIIKLHWAFQSASQFFFVFGFCPGGELSFHLKNIGRLTENQARFYFAEVLTAVDYLHRNNVVYNNIKAENIMLDIDGHLKLVDFSLASANLWEDSITFTLGAGNVTNLEEGEDRSQDFFDLGCFLYELLTNQKLDVVEVKGDDGLSTKKIVIKSQGIPSKLSPVLNFPKYLSDSCKDLLSYLLERSKSSQITTEALKNHQWCEGIDWQKLARKRVSPPFRPNLKKSNFSLSITKVSTELSSLSGEYIRGFDYKSPEIEKSFFNIGEMILESNVTSERNSTDAEDTFNNLSTIRSLDTSSRFENLDGSQSFLMHRNVTKNEPKASFKSVSPVERDKRFSSLKNYLKDVTGINKLFGEDRRNNIEMFSEELKSDSKMREIIRKKIVNIK